ncbi:MAG: 2-amino-4-hydroxy-6-hydroxymethyldihydropteridine diphosphokinase [Bacteroidales bacterium]|nr:2-amino-4-hydroxy-6-hydroxymethyldihydropteridine diphosphokinase [Bacteroidales bacterium]
MHTTYLSLGTNLGNRNRNLGNARHFLSDNAGTLSAASSLYTTEPWGFVHRNRFYNQVLELRTVLNPFELLEKIRDIEKMLGRRRHAGKYSARTIDIDILFYDDRVIMTDELVIPHPLIEERLFVLVPLEEIAPLFIHPVRQVTIRQLLTDCPDQKSVIKIHCP